MTALPPSLGRTFLLAAGELGFFSAARIFVRETAAAYGADGVRALREQHGRDYSVLDAVAARYLDTGTLPGVDATRAAAALSDASRVLVVGFEADALDLLVPLLPAVPAGLLMQRSLGPVDWDRVLANFDDRLKAVPFDDLQKWAGSRAALLTFVYGTSGSLAHVSSEWLRVMGPDVRPQFRSLLGWDLLPGGPEVYPRWLADADIDTFSILV